MGTSLQPNKLDPVIGIFADRKIKIGDPIVTFTKTYSGVKISLGVYAGAIEQKGKYGVTHSYLVDREDGSRSKLQYPRFVHRATCLENLDGLVIG